MNRHSDYLKKRIADIKKSDKWNTYIINTSHEHIIRDFNACVFTNLILSTFGRGYVKKHKCVECKAETATERCHGENEDRPILLKKALERVYPDTSKSIQMKQIIIAFLEEHLNSTFDFKCKSCHLRETIQQRRASKTPRPENNPPSEPQLSSSQPASPPISLNHPAPLGPTATPLAEGTASQQSLPQPENDPPAIRTPSVP